MVGGDRAARRSGEQRGEEKVGARERAQGRAAAEGGDSGVKPATNGRNGAQLLSNLRGSPKRPHSHAWGMPGRVIRSYTARHAGPAFLIVLCLSTAAFSQPSELVSPVLVGYVTRAVSGSDFDVNGVRVICGPDTKVGSPTAVSYASGCGEVAPAFGQKIEVYGHLNKKKLTVAAQWLDIKPIARDDISGFAVIDAVGGADAGRS